MNKRIEVLGYPVDNLTTDELLDRIDDAIEKDTKTHIVAINANKLYQVRNDLFLAEIIKNAEIVIPEYAIMWASKLLQTPLVEHIGGIMLMRSLLEASRQYKFSFFFLGARNEILEMMVSNIQAQYGNGTIAGWHHGYFSDDARIIDQINDSAANILLVAMGVPRQEYFIYQNKARIKAPIMLGVGGSFDVFAGIRKETPSFFRHGFEWIYRLAQDPKNLWKRYLTTNTYFVYQVLKSKLLKVNLQN